MAFVLVVVVQGICIDRYIIVVVAGCIVVIVDFVVLIK